MLKALEEEESTDNQMRSQYNQKWNRLPSNALNLQFKNSLNDFRNKASMAAEQDLKVETKWNSQKDQLQILTKTKADLAGMIPQSAETADMSQNPTVLT